MKLKNFSKTLFLLGIFSIPPAYAEQPVKEGPIGADESLRASSPALYQQVETLRKKLDMDMKVADAIAKNPKDEAEIRKSAMQAEKDNAGHFVSSAQQPASSGEKNINAQIPSIDGGFVAPSQKNPVDAIRQQTGVPVNQAPSSRDDHSSEIGNAQERDIKKEIESGSQVLKNEPKEAASDFSSVQPAPPWNQQKNKKNTTPLSPKDKIFNAAVIEALPMSPDQIRKLRRIFSEVRRAEADLPGIPPKTVCTSQFVKLSPGSTPPVIRLSQGFVTSVVFLDSTGAPWPISDYDVGNSGAFNIQWNRVDNTLMVQSMVQFAYGNIAVRLKGLSIPIMMTFLPGQQVIDYRVDLTVEGFGPYAVMPSVEQSLPKGTDPVMFGFLEKMAPEGSQALEIKGSQDVQAWLYQDKLYVRGKFSLISPAWFSYVSSADGMKVYELERASVILISSRGKTLSLNIEGI